MSDQHFVSMNDVQAEARQVAYSIRETIDRRRGYAVSDNPVLIYGVPRGGYIPALMVIQSLMRDGIPAELAVSPSTADFIVDDIYDSGATSARLERSTGKKLHALFDKAKDSRYQGRWLVMPWETINENDDKSGEDIVIRLLQFIGEDPTREGLRDTPKRVLKAWTEWANPEDRVEDVKDILKVFEDGAEKVDEMVIVHGIPVVSKCEHHLADIVGTADVGYIPDGAVVGLSKLARLVDHHARRLQVQERLTMSIAEDLYKHVPCRGVGVLIRASHACMSTRGVKIHGAVTTTSAMKGVLMTKPEARAEFLALCREARDA